MWHTRRGGRCKVLSVRGSRVTILHMETGNRETIDLQEFLASYHFGARATLSNPPKALKWNMYGGGTGAWEGAHGYSVKVPFGSYHVDPVTTRYGRRAGYVVRFSGEGPQRPPTGGVLKHTGLWHELGRASSPNQGKRMAADHYAQLVSEAVGQAFDSGTLPNPYDALGNGYGVGSVLIGTGLQNAGRAYTVLAITGKDRVHLEEHLTGRKFWTFARHYRVDTQSNPRRGRRTKGEQSAHSIAAGLGYPYVRGDGRPDSQGRYWLSRFTRKSDGKGPAVFVGFGAGDRPIIEHDNPGRGGERLRSIVSGGVARRERGLSVPDRHRLRIARDTLKMSDAGARIMGGMTKDEAREVIYQLTGVIVAKENPRRNPEAYFERFTIKMPNAAVFEMSGAGAADEFVAYWASRIKRPAAVTPEALAAELREYGAWDPDELSDDADNWRRILWIAAGNLREESQANPSRSPRARRARSRRRRGEASGPQSRREYRARARYRRYDGNAPLAARASASAKVHRHLFSSEARRKRWVLGGSKRRNPRVQYGGGVYVNVTATKREVKAFKARWPASGLPDKAITFVFDTRNGDLVGHTSGIDSAYGSGALPALAADMWEAAKAKGPKPNPRGNPEPWEVAYRAWRTAAEKGYGRTTSAVSLRRIDARIARLRGRYEKLLAEAKGRPYVKPNPRTETERAKATFRKWHEFDSHHTTRVKGPSRTIPKTLVKLGDLVSVVYKSNKYTGKPTLYEHKTKSPHPVLAADPDGQHVHIVGGKMRITGDGLVN
jgi:hypothetical protein